VKNIDKFLPTSTDEPEAVNGIDLVPMDIDQGNEIDEKMQKKTLAQILVEAIEVCVYCGGHLYDKAARYGSGPGNSGNIALVKSK